MTMPIALQQLNPDAGSHPIPEDPRAIEAAEAAGLRLRLAYPYLVWRWSARGERFSVSDAAWLITLADQQQSVADAQVDWLAQILAPRGMPRLLLQRTLEVLYEELLVRLAGRAEAWARLLGAADRLAAQRRAVLDDAALDRISGAFNRAVGPDWRARLPGTGALIAAACVDERLGPVGSRAATCDWLCDEDRFPPAWCAAVRRALEAADAACRAPQPAER